jgi:hypothetical protein
MENYRHVIRDDRMTCPYDIVINTIMCATIILSAVIMYSDFCDHVFSAGDHANLYI